MFHKSVLGILRRNTHLYFETDRGTYCLVSLQYFMVPYSAQFMRRLGIQATFDKSLKGVVSRTLSSAILNFLGI